MTVEIKNSPDESTVNDSKKFTGVIPYSVIAINPTKDELHELGLTFIKTEPNYQRTFDNGGEERKSTIVDVWLKSIPDVKHPDLDMVTKVIFFINNEPFLSKNTGKQQYVNIYGRTAWAKEPADLDNNEWYINKESRPAHRGEEDLYKFLFAWLNMSYEPKRDKLNPCRVDVQKLFKSDYSELQDIVTKAQSYVVKALTGVRRVEGDDGTVKYYPTVYNKYFLKHNQKSTDTMEKYINKDEYNEFKDAYYYTYKIEEFDPSVLPDDDKEEGQPAMSVGNTNEDPF